MAEKAVANIDANSAAAILRGLKVGFAFTGSHCTLAKAVEAMAKLYDMGVKIIPIISETVRDSDTRFGSAQSWREEICLAAGGAEIIDSIVAAEPIGPKSLLDVLVIAPCSGNTLGKLACGITDTTVTMSAKAHLRNQKPLVIALSTNDALSANCKNIGLLLNTKNIFFVPFGQDNPMAKATSMVADMQQIPQTVALAAQNIQIQPLLV